MKTLGIFSSLGLTLLASVILFQCHLWNPDPLPVPCPEISGFAPAGAGFGKTVTIKGNNFCAGYPELHVLKIGTQVVPVDSIEVPDAQTIEFKVPKGVGDGIISVQLLTADNCPAESANKFIYHYTIGNAEVYAGVNGNTTCASCLYFPQGMDVDPAGNLYVADKQHHKILRIDLLKSVVKIAGNGTGTWQDDHNGLFASFNRPSDVVLDNSGNIFVADLGNHRIRKISAGSNRSVSTISGTGSNSSTNGPLLGASYRSPIALAINPANDLIFVVEHSGSQLRKIDFNTSLVSTILPQTDPNALLFPIGVVYDAINNKVVVADRDHLIVKSIDPGNSMTRILGGSIFTIPVDVAHDSKGNFFVLDSDRKSVFVIYTDGTTNEVKLPYPFGSPSGLAYDKNRNFLYISDELRQEIVKLIVE